MIDTPKLDAYRQYEATLTTLFALLSQANSADSDFYKQGWQKPNDASQTSGYFGSVANAITDIAGEHILDHWCRTNEICMKLADRRTWICRGK